MKIVIITVGKKHSSEFANAISLYEERLQTHYQLSWEFIPSKSTVSAESKSILQKLAPTDYVVLLDGRGKQLSSPDVAELLETVAARSFKRIVFVIGGAYGVDASVVERADMVWSLGKLTFPHQLVRVMLIEQLYRAHSIIGGGRYHHE